ncbi:Pol Polyprotein [Phytophthora megakarya]|uniref:Pol Polyprotein n=1 Tax=Phytophthora megakarya TaxID=4795 RepID=A0A225VAB0_9STRA|nr:Pol Polyprotein [Phytophthora megakarya]
MPSNNPADVTFEKIKSNGTVAADDDEGHISFVEDIQGLLFGEVMQQFNDTVVEESILQPTTNNNWNSNTQNGRNNNGGGRNDKSFPATQEQVAEMATMMQEIKRRHEEELVALHFYREGELSVMIDVNKPIPDNELVEAFDPLSTIDGEMLSASERFEVEHLVEAFRHVCSGGLGKIKAKPFYPLPVIGNLLRQFRKSKYVSSLDIPLSYYACILAEISHRVTAIEFPWGRFVFGCLPMGVKTAPDEFQSIMNVMLGDLDGRFEGFGLTNHLRTSKLCTSSIIYLGYWISSTGIQPLHNKVEAIPKVASLRTRRELRRFISMVNYYRDTWPRRAAILSPLSTLMSPSVPFRWSDEHEAAFTRMKIAVMRTVELAFPGYSKPFHVHTDTSGYQLGVVISQSGRPLEFWSQKCNDGQKYPAYKFELLSIKLVLQEFRTVLFGDEIEIEEFGPKLHYVKGENNVVADILSRLPRADDTSLQYQKGLVVAVARALTTLSNGDVRKIAHSQKRDGTKTLKCATTKVVMAPPYDECFIHPGATTMLNTMQNALTWTGMAHDIE